MHDIHAGPGISRRRLLTAGAAGVSIAVLGGARAPAQETDATAPPAGPLRQVSPRGSLAVLDDYPYWVARKLGYFGDIETTLEPGTAEPLATMRVVAQNLADIGAPSPQILALGLARGMPLVSVFQLGGADPFDLAFRKGQRPAGLKALEGKSIVLGALDWRPACDVMLRAAGVDIAALRYIDGGWPGWGRDFAAGRGDAALAWEGLRAQWDADGLAFDYLLGRDISKLPGSALVVRKADLAVEAKRERIASVLKGWAAGLEFAHHNPRAAAQIVTEQFPDLAARMDPKIATETLIQIAGIYRARWDERKAWGAHRAESWALYFDTAKAVGLLRQTTDIAGATTDELVGAANAFDAAKVKADAGAFTLSEAYAAVDAAAMDTAP
jgi:NitT/TauT family transport system substrate-binding protein